MFIGVAGVLGCLGGEYRSGLVVWMRLSAWVWRAVERASLVKVTLALGSRIVLARALQLPSPAPTRCATEAPRRAPSAAAPARRRSCRCTAAAARRPVERSLSSTSTPGLTSENACTAAGTIDSSAEPTKPTRSKPARAGVERPRGRQTVRVRPVSPLLGLTVDVDATLIACHSEQENAAANYTRGHGFHPMRAYLDETPAANGTCASPSATN